MLNMERVQYIMDALRESRVVYVKELAQRFYLSESTIRRDLVMLEKEGLIRRLYGGAMLLDRTVSEIPYAVRTATDIPEKSQIGKLAAQLVKDEMTIFMDTSSTIGEMVQYLKKKRNLRIITNSAYLSLRVSEFLDAEIICLGGRMNSYSKGFVGENAVRGAEAWYADFCFISSRCLSMENGCTDNNDDEVHVKRAMLEHSKHVAFLYDSSKFDTTSVRNMARLNELDYLVTERKPSDKWIQVLEANGVQLLWQSKCDLEAEMDS